MRGDDMGLIARWMAFLRVLRRKKRPMDTLRLVRRRPALLLGVNAFETALLASGRVPGYRLCRRQGDGRHRAATHGTKPVREQRGLRWPRTRGAGSRRHHGEDAHRHPERADRTPARTLRRSTARRARRNDRLGELPGPLQSRLRRALVGLLRRRILPLAREACRYVMLASGVITRPASSQSPRLWDLWR